MNEIELRDQIVAGIRRSLFGPDSLATTVWPGSPKPASVVDDDFDPKQPFKKIVSTSFQAKKGSEIKHEIECGL